MKKVYRFFEVMKPYGILPKRATKKSAGYDFYVPDEVILEPGESKVIKLGIRAYMQSDEVLMIHIRSSIGMKRNTILGNVTGVIDSDYYGNEDNGGEICLCLKNIGDVPCYINAHERVAQGIFTKYLLTDDDHTENERVGGIGSTNEGISENAETN